MKSGGLSANASFGASLGLSLGASVGAALSSHLAGTGINTGGVWSDSIGGIFGVAITGALNASVVASPLSASLIASDCASSCGETLGAFDCGSFSVGTDYVRGSGPASSSLCQVIGGSQWWVDTGGVTHVGTRPTLTPADGSYETLSYSPLHRTANIACDDPSSIWVGSVLTDRLSEPQTIRELHIHGDKNEMRIKAYCGGSQEDTSRIGRAFDSYLEQRENQRLTGVYKYKVFEQNADGTLALQVVRSLSAGLSASLPDIIPITQAVGIAKSLSTLKEGDVVRVMFDNGDARSPFVAVYPPGDASKVSGIVRMSDLISSGGYGTWAIFSFTPVLPGGIPNPGAAAIDLHGVPVVACGVPYLVNFGNAFDVIPVLAPPTGTLADLETVQPLFGYALSASEQEIE